MAVRIIGSTPRQDGYRMPAEYEPQERIWMLWPERKDTWRLDAVPGQKAYAAVAEAISQFEPVTMCASHAQLDRCQAMMPAGVQVVEMESDDAWMRDCGPTFLVNDRGGLRACDWKFNAWGGTYDGTYSSWEKDEKVAQQVCELAGADSYRTEDFVLEGGSIHVDGEGTVLTTKMCLLSPGRNPLLSQAEIEDHLKAYLNVKKVLWLSDGMDPQETDGHIDDVACFVRPGEAACIYTEDPSDPFYDCAQKAYRELSEMTDAKGRKLKVHPICLPARPVVLHDMESLVMEPGSQPRRDGDIAIASYLNFLIVNGGVIVPQYGDQNDALALEQIQALFPDRRAVAVRTEEVAYGGGNIHCITQQQPKCINHAKQIKLN